MLRVHQAAGDGRVLAARDAWLAEDPAHAEAYAEAELVWRLTGALRPAFPQHVQRRRSPRRWRHGRALAVFCGALAACLVVAVLPDLRLNLTADHVTAAGVTEHVVLPDGSAVNLDAKSAVTLDFSTARRTVTVLSGRAFFDVAHDDSRAFQVVAGDVTVTVTGTAFEVDVAQDAVAIDVQRGSVKVAVSKDQTFALTPGERLTLDRKQKSTVIGQAAPEQTAAWRSGRLVVDGRLVGDVVDELRRYYPGVILMPGSNLAAHRVTGVFDLTDPASAVRAVVAPYAGQVIQITPYILLVRAG